MISDRKLKIKTDVLTNKLSAGLFDEVIAEAKGLLRNRSHQIVYNILSIAYQSLGKFDLSVKIMEEALKKNPKNPYFLNNMGISKHKLESFEEAEHYFKKGLDVAPNYINILNNIGNLKKDLNQIDEAIFFYKKSLLINENLTETQFNLAAIYITLGKFDDAEYHLNKILSIDPKFTEADRLISTFTKYRNDSHHLKTMISKIEDKTLSKNQLMHLHFALGKSFEDIKRYEDSFRNLNKANQYLSEIVRYDTHQDIKNFNKIKETIKYINHIKINKNIRQLIFIVGMPRSGTSLVEQIISSHSNVFGGGELPFLSNSIHNKILDNQQLTSIKSNDLTNLLEIMQEEYISKISKIDSSGKVFIDKAPLNFRYIGFIKKVFPNSKIINCNRDPIDICWSNYKNYFSTSLPFSNNLNNLAKYYSLYQNYIKFWKELFADEFFNINYEKLVENPKKEIKDLLTYCNLEWEENCLKHENNSKSIKTASWAQVRKPIYKSAVKSSDYFRVYLDELIKNIKV